MKPRTAFYFVIVTLALAAGSIWLLFSTRDVQSRTVFRATVTRDCAPWDGAAFTISIPYDRTTTVTISIWQSPDILFPAAFSFPDETGRVGFAYSLAELDPLQPLAGRVSFTRVDRSFPVEGEFDLHTETGGQFQGKFIADWGNTYAMCG
jgi:hypothetical protein